MALRLYKRGLWTTLWLIVISLMFARLRALAQGGQATLIMLNFVGSELVLTLDEQLYHVPGVDTAPEGGRLTVQLSPGRHSYSGHIPGGPGQNGSVELAAGQTVILGARLDRSGPVVSPAGIVLEPPQDTLVFFEAGLAPPAATATPTPSLLEPLSAGQGGLVLVNYIGEPLQVDIGGVLYTVPANQRRQINLAPGEVRYSASAGRSSLNGTAVATSGAYTGLGFSRELPAAEPDYRVGKPVPTPVPLALSVFPIPVMNGPEVETPAAPESPSSPATPSAGTIPAGQSGLEVVNYIGEAVTFTINNQMYTVAANSALSLNLPPGEYTFTASIPKAAENGSLRLQPGQMTRLSLALAEPGERVEVYVE